MSSTPLLPGISQHSARTDRLEIAYLEAGSGNVPVVLVHGNVSSSAYFQDLMLALTATGRYRVYAPDMRGYGDSETLPVDATRGVRDFSDDLDAFARAINLTSFHLLGWSLGGNVVMQYVIDYPGKVRSLILESTSSPFGFGGTKDATGTPIWPDFAGSGGGTANPEFVRLLAEGDRGVSQASPRTVMKAFYFKPTFQLPQDREEMFLTSMLTTKVTPGNYPGDNTPSPNWPTLAPGTQGVNNSISPKYLNQGNFAAVAHKPPVLWIHGTDDQIVSDTSFLDFGYLGQLGFVPGWPGAEIYSPQPMKSQVRFVLESYKGNGGEYEEVELANCGHSPHIEQFERVFELVDAFAQKHELS